jgi:2-oxoisovalerate dehydrogenase E1 component alpha subunit
LTTEFPTYQVLSPEGEIIQPPKFPLSDDLALKILRAMWTSRLVDERMITLTRQGLISFAMSSLGEEGCVAASAAALSIEDWIYPQYRENAAIFYRGHPIEDYVHHMFCNGKDIILGRQMPNHFGSRQLNVVTVSSPIGTKMPHAAGSAYGMKLKGEKTCTLVYFGEGASSEGDFHAGLNFASVYKTPTIFFCRNNQYAISTKACSQFQSQGIVEKAPGYGMAGVRVDGNDPLAVYSVTLEARERAIRGEGPTLIEAMTYRMGAHSTSDDPSRYRVDGELEKWAALCPLDRLTKYLEKKGLWDLEKTERLTQEIQSEITRSIQVAKSTPPPPEESLIEGVYKEIPRRLLEEFKEAHG